ncbi:MAG: dihydrofolate reductase family protein [Gelidibacter sp.]|uniref:dihydrofolate reductase family protein n=1 Tax=Gelidibacter sp. TaxID=2018083 RepID=UPI003266EFD8
MKKVLVFVTTLDGKITHWGDAIVRKWSSEEDKRYFKKVWDDSPLTVMGSTTFNADPMKPTPTHHLVVMTRTPAKYKDQEVIGQLEFTDHSPAQLVAHYKKEGFKQMTVVGGPHIATSFLKEKLIDELWLTIEPKIFGTGGNFVVNENLDVDLQLLSVEKVNERGTLITKYAVIK